MLRGNPLEFEVATNSAMGIHQAAKRKWPRAKPCFAGFAPPRQNAHEAEEVVGNLAAPRAPEFRTVTGRAGEPGGVDLRPPGKA
jgi:hypothetical protein